MTEPRQDAVDLKLIDYKLNELQKDFKILAEDMKNSVVTRVEFELRVGRIEKLVYGMVGFILIAVLSAVVYGVIKK